MIKVIFPDNRRIEGETPEEVEEQIRKMQWDQHETQEEFREEMGRRALEWSGVEIDTDGNSLDFLMELERGQILTLALIYSPPLRMN